MLDWLLRAVRGRTVVSSPAEASDAAVGEQLSQAKTLADGGDYAAAYAIWHELTERGVARAARNLGVCYMFGHGVACDPKRAIDWFRRAAEAGYVDAQRDLGIVLIKARPIAKTRLRY